MIMYELIENFLIAERAQYDDSVDPPYVAVVIEMDEYVGLELIVNPAENARRKMEYYKNTYNLDGTHKKGAPVRIIDSFVTQDADVMYSYHGCSDKWRRDHEKA